MPRTYNRFAIVDLIDGHAYPVGFRTAYWGLRWLKGIESSVGIIVEE